MAMYQAVAKSHPTYKPGSSAKPTPTNLAQSIDNPNPTQAAQSSAKPNVAMYQAVANPNPTLKPGNSAKPTPTYLVLKWKKGQDSILLNVCPTYLFQAKAGLLLAKKAGMVWMWAGI